MAAKVSMWTCADQGIAQCREKKEQETDLKWGGRWWQRRWQ